MTIIYTHFKKPKQKKKPGWKKAQAEYEAWLEKHGVSKKATKSKSTTKNNDTYVPTQVFRRETPHYPSLMTNSASTCTKPIQGKVYTGTKMIGIGTLHKSNAVPIFSEESAKDQATMRR